MKAPKTLIALCLAGSVYASTAISGFADTPAFTTTDTTPTLPGDYGLNALVFTVTAPITVDALGYYAYSLGGGDQPVVDLYSVATTGSTAVATELATTGTLSSAGTTANAFNYTSITPVTLLAGTYMVAGGLYYAPEFANFTPTTDPAIASETTYKTSSDFFGSSYSNHFDPNGYATTVVGAGVTSVENFTFTSGAAEGVNFEFTDAVAAPEPSTYAMLAAGMILLGVVLRRRMQRA